MFKPLVSEPLPYVLQYDQQGPPPHTIFHLTPQTAEETTGYLRRYGKEARRGGVDEEMQAVRLVSTDREKLARITTRIENAFTAGDSIEDEDGIRKVISKLDYSSLQEVLNAAQNMSALGEPAKNS